MRHRCAVCRSGWGDRNWDNPCVLLASDFVLNGVRIDPMMVLAYSILVTDISGKVLFSSGGVTTFTRIQRIGTGYLYAYYLLDRHLGTLLLYSIVAAY